jgi:hypothetical protein
MHNNSHLHPAAKMSMIGNDQLVIYKNAFKRRSGLTPEQFRVAFSKHARCRVPWTQLGTPRSYILIHVAAVNADNPEGFAANLDGIEVIERSLPYDKREGEALLAKAENNRNIKEREKQIVREFAAKSCVDEAPGRLPNWSLEKWVQWADSNGAEVEKIIWEGETMVEVPEDMVQECRQMESGNTADADIYGY